VSCCKHIPLYLVLAAALVACQPLPQPFKPEVKGRAVSPLVLPTGETSLFVTPVAGLPGDAAAAMASAVAEALAEREIPASANARSALSSVLSISMEPLGTATMWHWSKRRPDGAIEDIRGQRLNVTASRLAEGHPTLLKQTAAGMAEAIAAKLNEGNAVAANTAPAKLSLLECDGAPGDGNRSLRQALREILILAGLPPVSDPASADYLVACHIKVWQDTAESERVTIEWALLAPDGRRLGEVKQANRIPRGQLANAWGATAHIVAQGGWQGLSRILETQRRQTSS
jgi:hypothetical protein